MKPSYLFPPRCLVAAWTLFLAIWLPSVSAVQINWTLPDSAGFAHRLSSGALIPDGFRFQIGAFDEGFVPAAANANEWADAWRGLSSATYATNRRGISVAFHAASRPAHFAENRQLYVFGYRLRASGLADVFLATDPAWKMPSSNPMAMPLTVDVNLAADIIVGQVDRDSIETALALLGASPAQHYAEWVLDRFNPSEQSDPLVSGARAKPAGDGVPNLIKYFAGVDPKQPLVGPLSVRPDVEGRMRLSSKFNDSARVSWRLLHSADLQTWTVADPQPAPNALRNAVELDFTPKGGAEFWRIEVIEAAP